MVSVLLSRLRRLVRRAKRRNAWGTFRAAFEFGYLARPFSGSKIKLLRSPSATRQSLLRSLYDEIKTGEETHGFASLPRGRFTFIGAIVLLQRTNHRACDGFSNLEFSSHLVNHEFRLIFFRFGMKSLRRVVFDGRRFRWPVASSIPVPKAMKNTLARR